ncbi:hypothetical protein PAAG_02315 [Paracoccidioides lutzii Pb01]|uniref:Uncharacterized protein n=1 Tax=Paracoccidioides lutzii (strain ATCC MYA-826 / Pb01) TaxID=502779 RepID=C1GVN8_PARBA|nr:hypothetical protein PAAG_02315 [Paracoccidioides lutzii Pb01]EEH40260.2 hypothetical protein PAAG_02315 [Paracoccidioides lutzii Pb01]
MSNQLMYRIADKLLHVQHLQTHDVFLKGFRIFLAYRPSLETWIDANYSPYLTQNSRHSYEVDISDAVMTPPQYGYSFRSQSYARRTRLDLEVEPIDFEMSLDIEEQAALSAQKERNEKRIRGAGYHVYENCSPGREGCHGPFVSFCNRHQGPHPQSGASMPQNMDGDDEREPAICEEGQNEQNQDISGMEMGVDLKEGVRIKTDSRGYEADDDDEPCEPVHSYTHIYTEDRILTLRIPYLGPVGWTVPARNGIQTTRPFLIYQDPTAGYASPPMPAEAGKHIDEHIHLLASDDKENVADDLEEEEDEREMTDRDIYVQDNMVAEAESIVALAAMNDGWNIRSLRNRLQHLGHLGHGYHGNSSDAQTHGLDPQLYGYGDDTGERSQQYLDHQHQQQQQDDQPEMEINVTPGGSLEASPVRPQRAHAHSNSVVMVSSSRRAGRLDEGFPRPPSEFF